MKTAAGLIQALGLSPHPEGGFFRETHRSDLSVTRPDGIRRQASTAIYYLLETGDFSAWHRIASDELWHFYAGHPLDIHVLQGSQCQTWRLGNPLETPGASFQHLVPAGAWFAAEPAAGLPTDTQPAYSLVGCTVAPGFEFSEFELANANDLTQAGAAHWQRLLARTPT